MAVPLMVSSVRLFVFIGTATLVSSSAVAQSAADRCYKETGDASIAACNQAIRENPSRAVLWVWRGVEWSKKGDKDRAIADFNQAIRLNPKNADAFLSRAKAWNDKREFEIAISDYTDAIRLSPSSAETYNYRGWAYVQIHAYELAISDFNAAIRLKPRWTLPYLNRGVAWERKGSFDKALSDANVVITLDRQSALGYNNRGSAWHKMGEYTNAIADYNEAIRLNPSDQLARNNLRIVLEEQKTKGLTRVQTIRTGCDHAHGANALLACTDSIKRNHRDAYAYYTRGMIWLDRGDYDKSVEDFDIAISLKGSDVTWLYNRGFALFRKGEYVRAIADFDEIARIDPANSFGQTNRASSLKVTANGILGQSYGQQPNTPAASLAQEAPEQVVRNALAKWFDGVSFDPGNHPAFSESLNRLCRDYYSRTNDDRDILNCEIGQVQEVDDYEIVSVVQYKLHDGSLVIAHVDSGAIIYSIHYTLAQNTRGHWKIEDYYTVSDGKISLSFRRDISR